MADQFTQGTDFVTGDQVTAANLMALVTNAKARPPIINDQTAGTTLADTDSVLVASSSALKRVTGAVIRTGLIKADGTVPMTGELTLSTSAPTAALKAASKGYVDTKVADYLPKAGGTVTGALTVTGVLTTNSTLNAVNGQVLVPLPIFPESAVRLSYLEGQLSLYGYKAKLNFSGVTPEYSGGSSTLKTSEYLSVLILRNSGQTTATINFSSLGSNYKNTASPFFLAGQYIGLESQTGLAGKLYKIQSVNNTAYTFTITTEETTVLNQSATLTLLFNHLSASSTDFNVNVKSVYLDVSCGNKHYFNFKEDLFVGGWTPSSVYDIRGLNVTGQAVDRFYLSQAFLMIDANRSTYNFNPNVPEGFGATNMGCHVGYFYTYNAGMNSGGYFTQANVAFL
jgi:hypothetical protein